MSIEIPYVVVGIILLIIGNLIGIFALRWALKSSDPADDILWGLAPFIITWMCFLFIGNDHYHWIVFI